MKPSEILKQTTIQQIREDYQEAPKLACALGAIALESGWKGYFTKTGNRRKKQEDVETFLYEKVGIDYDTQEEVIELNDSRHWTFKSIARWLEKRGL